MLNTNIHTHGVERFITIHTFIIIGYTILTISLIKYKILINECKVTVMTSHFITKE